jgi:hypothetical protein
LVTEIKKKLTGSKVGIQFALKKDRTSKLTIWLSKPLGMWELSSYIRPYRISIWQLTMDALCRRKSLPVQHALYPESVLNRAPRWAKKPVRICMTVVSPNPASFDYFLVKMSLLAYAIVR